ncbi:MAG: MFS transporter [Flavobacteriia bacterium]|nr:MAG: MFS transporter [Flavobacteriia bacterium]
MSDLEKNKPLIAPEDKVPFKSKLAYAAAGPVDVLGIWVLVSIAYQVFNMELKLPPTYVAIILMSLRLWDGVLDPIMGWISDNTRTKWGRRRPYIFVGAIMAGLLYPLIWWFPTDLSHFGIMMWVIGFGILFYTFFTIWGVPYQSLLMEMTPDYNERTRVAEVRSYFQTVAGFVNGWIWWLSMLPIFWIVVDGKEVASPVNGMRYISLIIGGLIIVLGILPAIFLKERYYESDVVQNQKKIAFFEGLGETFSNKPFIILSLLTVFFLMGQAIFDGYGRYVGTYYVLGGDWDMGAKFAGYGTVVYTIFSLMFIPVFRKLSEKIGKKKVLMIAIGLAIISYATTWWTFTPSNPWLMLLNTVFIGAGYAGLWLMLPSMQVDVVDYDEFKTGERREGSFSSIYSWVLKLSFMVGFLVSGPLLELTGFDAELGSVQPEEVYTNMRIGFLVIPLVALTIAFLLLRTFPITAKKAAEIRAELEERRGKV